MSFMNTLWHSWYASVCQIRVDQQWLNQKFQLTIILLCHGLYKHRPHTLVDKLTNHLTHQRIWFLSSHVKYFVPAHICHNMNALCYLNQFCDMSCVLKANMSAGYISTSTMTSHVTTIIRNWIVESMFTKWEKALWWWYVICSSIGISYAH